MNIWKTWAPLAAAMAMLAPAAPAGAAEWPERELHMSVNYGAGGVTDTASRVFAKGLEKQLGKPVVVFNRPGAQATLGPAHLMMQKPDGYEIGVVTQAALSIAPHLVTTPFTTDNFEFIGAFGRFRFGIAVRADSPYRTVADLVNAAKAAPNPVFFGAPGAPQNVTMFDLGRKSGAKFEQVLYKSGPESIAALMGGSVEVVIQTPSEILPHVKSGKLRLLASASPSRWPEMPEVPTMREAGFDVGLQSWMGLLAPKGLPRDVFERLRSALFAVARDGEFMQTMTGMGIDAITLTGPEFRKVVNEAHAEMGEFQRIIGAKKP